MGDEVQVNVIGMLIETLAVSVLDLVVMGCYAYLAMLFKAVAEANDDGDYKLVANGFWLIFLAQLIPFLYYLIKPFLLIDDRFNLYYADTPYFICVFLAIALLMKFAKRRLRKSV